MARPWKLARPRQILFRIFYSTTFTIVFLVLIGFIGVSPIDSVYQSYRRNRLLDVFIVTGAYVLTGLFAALIYSSRLYTNRSVLKDIPKTFIPLEKNEVPGRRIRRLIETCMNRSAVIAYHARPRSRRLEHEVPDVGARIAALINPDGHKSQTLPEPKWGPIAHPGWSSPASADLANLEYATVIEELTDLIEAKAVSLAPIDPLATPGPDGVAMPDRRVIEILTRPTAMGMRPYFSHLVELGVIPNNSLSTAFLAHYERARFAAEPVADAEFQSVMRMFAEVLRNMTQIDVDVDLGEYLSSSNESSSSASVRHNRPPRRVSEDSVPSMATAEDDDHLTRPPLLSSFVSAASRPPMESRFVSAASRPSLRPAQSHTSVRSIRTQRSNGSVIRLADAGHDDLPYTIQIPRNESI